MLFNSFAFLLFFAALVVVYYLIPHRFRWMLLLAASLYFYSTFNLNYVFLLIACTLLAYGAAWIVSREQNPGRRRSWLALGVIASLAPLFVFKYFDFFSTSLAGALTNVQGDAAPDLRLYSCLSLRASPSTPFPA